ncbi:MAG: S-layer homology domain-containing protein [Clostridia bacterium]|nr:S-layer homology domain-containing protein [Clostridia bacterium]
MGSRRKGWLLFLAIALLFGLIPQVSISAAEERRAPLSPAISVLAGKTDLSSWGLLGETQMLDAECFLRGLNLGRLDSVRIRTLPERTAGRLLFDKTPVQAGQYFSFGELSRLSFEPVSNRIGSTSFLFEANGCGVDYTCRLYSLQSANASPSLSETPALLQNLITYKNCERSGSFWAEDPEGDAVTFEIVSYPRYGSLKVNGDSYCYRPFSDYVGEDFFSYVARDLYGNYSASMAVSIRVSAEGADLVFADIDDPATYSAARTLASHGILDGSRLGNAVYFYPERDMKRGEFLVSAMNAMGMTALPACEDTGFADDDKIPASMKPYVFAAYRLGYINGKTKDGTVLFLPEERMTLGEAAELIDRLLLTDAPKTQIPVFGSSDADTKNSVSALASLGVIPIPKTAYPANQVLTRGETAKLLEKVFFLTQTEKF